MFCSSGFEMHNLIYCLSFIAILSSCTHYVTKFYPEIIPEKSEAVFPVAPTGKHKVNIVYLGCGNLVLEQNGEAILTDPFLSNQKLLKLLGRIKSHPIKYNTWKTNFEYFLSPAVVNTGLVSHTHYDHMMDLPMMLEDRYFLNLKAVYGNAYFPKMMKHFANEGTSMVDLKDSQVFNPTVPSDQSFDWIEVSKRIRFLPILSSHAPHTKKKLYMDKPLDEDHFDENLIYSNSKTKALKWTTGDTYSFLIDFVDTDTLRVFVQTSASLYPDGFPPQSELDKKNVDLAIICYASGMNVKDYPKALVNHIQPKKLMLVHWEDFFRTPKSFNDQRLVRRTNPRKFRKRIDELGKANDYFIMPKPGTKVVVNY